MTPGPKRSERKELSKQPMLPTDRLAYSAITVPQAVSFVSQVLKRDTREVDTRPIGRSIQAASQSDCL